MNIKQTISSIKDKYGLKISGETFESKVKKTIAEILNKIPKDKKIAVRGSGAHTKELFSIEGVDVKIECIFDIYVEKKDTKEIAGIKCDIYPNSAINDMDIDVIIISSYTHRQAIREELSECNKKIMIIDLYDELQRYGLDVNAPFYRIAEDTYENVIYYRKTYFAEKSADSLKNLIVAYLKIFDFINYEKFSVEYIENKYQDYQTMQMALDEIKKLLNSVKEELGKREKRDIITVWNDQMDYDYLQYASYMKEESKNSMFFENAYTMTPFTVPTFLGMFQGLKSIDDEIYFSPKPVSNETSSQMLRDIKDAGYEFVYVGDEADAKLFEKKNAMPNEVYNSACVRCVDLLQRLLDADKPVCAILHVLVETHPPYLSGELEEARWYEWPTFAGRTEEEALKQRKTSLKYIDKQLGFYMGFLPDDCIKIFMSDHGARYNYQPIYKEPTTHILFFITGKGVPKKRCKKMFSIYDFRKAVKCILDDDYSEDVIFSDYVILQEVNIFRNTSIRFYIENNAQECCLSFRAVRTQKELYVKLSSGKKYYFLLPDEETNCIENADMERIKQLDELAGDKFEDSSRHEEQLAAFRKKFETHE